MEDLANKPTEKRGFPRPLWIIIHPIVIIVYAILLLALPMYEAKDAEGMYHFDFFTATAGSFPLAPRIVFYVLFFLCMAGLLTAAAFFIVSFVFGKNDQWDRSDRFFMVGDFVYIGANALLALTGISLSLVIPLACSVVLALLGFLSLYLHFKKFALLSDH